MADLSYIDKFYDKVVRNLPDEELDVISRAPANVQVQDETTADIGIITPTPNYDFNSVAENFRKNEVSNIASQEGIERDARGRANKASVAELASRNKAREAVNAVNSPQDVYQDNPELLRQIENAKEKANADTTQPRDIWSELILSFGPAILGGLSGESGQIAQLQAGKSAREMYEGRRKESIEQAIKAKEVAQKQYEQLLKIKSEQRESWDKSQQRTLDRLKSIATAEVDFAKMDAQRATEFTKEANKISGEITKATSAGNKEYAALANKGLEEEGKAKRAKIIAEGQDLKQATNLRKEFNADPVVKNFKDVQQSYQKITDMAKKPSAAGDISMIFSYMKMLDPGSVVREGEQATAQNAAGISDQLRNQYNRLLNGERLTPKQRQDFINQARSIYDSQQSLVSNIEKDYKGLASEYGTSPSLVIPRSSAPLAPIYKDGDTKTIKGQTFIRKDGMWLPK
ncbi:MAG: hypothetical protein OM95_06865 [Bdellovibrio sp. ArHS]|uniref:hypothetical protein n=1 Tax=Bdellovibrio sp. ArHS TaxID=1569284 RepID=UPI0005833A86|nr:hypothetical protein [Bdellovibrio sp. ArHS]KHD88831.1 MAG: hypothetical protein OM95_06865 [Bdellovibrio sp. ArHS]